MSAIKERPILFSAPMVRAILEGQKTVARRAVKPQPEVREVDMIGPMLTFKNKRGGHWLYPNAKAQIIADCPYGQPGDRLWVREAWVADAQVNAVAPRDLSQGEPILYPADGAARQTGCTMIAPGKVRPSIHMPRWAYRLLLEITAVRVERLRDSADLVLLDELGDMLEDCDSTAGKEFSRIEHLQSAGAPLRMIPEMYGFKAWWDKTNGQGSFDASPWVWVVEFRRVQP